MLVNVARTMPRLGLRPPVGIVRRARGHAEHTRSLVDGCAIAGRSRTGGGAQRDVCRPLARVAGYNASAWWVRCERVGEPILLERACHSRDVSELRSELRRREHRGSRGMRRAHLGWDPTPDQEKWHPHGSICSPGHLLAKEKVANSNLAFRSYAWLDNRGVMFCVCCLEGCRNVSERKVPSGVLLAEKSHTPARL